MNLVFAVLFVSLLPFSFPFFSPPPPFSNTSASQTSLKHIADGGSLAEEVIYSIRTAQAFGIQKVLVTMYDKHVKKSMAAGLRGARIGSVCLAIMCEYSFSLDVSWGKLYSIKLMTCDCYPGCLVGIIYAGYGK